MDTDDKKPCIWESDFGQIPALPIPKQHLIQVAACVQWKRLKKVAIEVTKVV
jgi:hypothetical protein